MSEIRQDILTGEMVIIAPSRSERPHSDDQEDTACPFCPGNEAETPASVLELPLGASSAWFVRVFPNRFPIVSSTPAPAREGLPPGRSAEGVHEVVVETPVHDQEMWQRTADELQLTLTAYRERLSKHLLTPGIRYVAVFQNRGPGAGASLDHPHSQIVALSYVPAKLTQRMRHWRRHHARTGRCLLCDELSRERDDGRRIIAEEGGLLLYAPFGGVRPGEMILAPVEHSASFGSVGDDALRNMSELLLFALARMQSAFEHPSYNLVLQTWPKGRQDDPALHWFLRIIPRRAELGGFELSTGDYVSTLSPEDVAGMYCDPA